MALRSDINGTSAPTAELNGATSAARPRVNGRSTSNSVPASDDDEQRPLSAPNRRNGSMSLETKDDIEHHQQTRPVKPLLLRSKSDYAHRPMDEPEPIEDNIPEWGARHGFEDHYQSEDIISQLANVSCTSYLSLCAGRSVRVYPSFCIMLDRCRTKQP
jgi:regulator-associated protein of mTOR